MRVRACVRACVRAFEQAQSRHIEGVGMPIVPAALERQQLDQANVKSSSNASFPPEPAADQRRAERSPQLAADAYMSAGSQRNLAEMLAKQQEQQRMQMSEPQKQLPVPPLSLLVSFSPPSLPSFTISLCPLSCPHRFLPFPSPSSSSLAPAHFRSLSAILTAFPDPSKILTLGSCAVGRVAQLHGGPGVACPISHGFGGRLQVSAPSADHDAVAEGVFQVICRGGGTTGLQKEVTPRESERAGERERAVAQGDFPVY
jgi:hypothetical protein